MFIVLLFQLPVLTIVPSNAGLVESETEVEKRVQPWLCSPGDQARQAGQVLVSFGKRLVSSLT